MVVKGTRYRWEVFREIDKDQKYAADFGETQVKDTVVVQDRADEEEIGQDDELMRLWFVRNDLCVMAALVKFKLTSGWNTSSLSPP